MFSYLSLVWNVSDAKESVVASDVAARIRSHATSWQCILDEPGTRVFVADVREGSSSFQRLAGRAGVVLGTLFERPSDVCSVGVRATLDATRSDTIVASRGRELISRYWGRYVAFIRDTARGSTFVLRSPTGELDCVATEFRGVSIFASSTQVLAELGVCSSAIDWKYVAAFLSSPLYESERTGLCSIRRLVHGQCLERRAQDTLRQWYWCATDFAADPIDDEGQTLATMLRASARSCVHSWTACYDSALALLSGGFDSSVLVSLLDQAPRQPPVTCVNLRNRFDLSTDEREFARLAVKRTRFRLVELEQEVVFDLRDRLRMPATESPFSNFYLFAPDRGVARIAEETGAKVVLSGEGGDQVFYQNGAGYACQDYRRHHGIDAELLEFALDAARLEGSTVWEILFGRRYRSPRLMLQETITGVALVPADVRESVISEGVFVHPWLEGAADLPPGKWWHIFCLATAMDRDMADPTGPVNGPENLAPFTSQPLVELALRIPTYSLMSGGRDRGLARLAFRSDLPTEIRMRRSKAATYDSAKALLTHNLAFAREMLMDGALVRERMLDRAALESTLLQLGDGRGYAGQVLIYLLCEAWISRWQPSRERLAA